MISLCIFVCEEHGLEPYRIIKHHQAPHAAQMHMFVLRLCMTATGPAGTQGYSYAIAGLLEDLLELNEIHMRSRAF
jgi:hypothetical protein